MDRSELLHAFLMACAKDDTDEVDRLLEQLTDELNDGEGCFDREEIEEAMELTQAEFSAWDDGESIESDEDEDDNNDIPYREDDADGWDTSPAQAEAAE